MRSFSLKPHLPRPSSGDTISDAVPCGQDRLRSILIGSEVLAIVKPVKTGRGMIRETPTCGRRPGGRPSGITRRRWTTLRWSRRSKLVIRRRLRLLIEQYQGVIFGLCYRMMSHRQDAEDIVQETFLRALRAIAGFDAARPLRPWLLEIAANRCRTALSRRARRPPLAPPESIEDQADPRPGRVDHRRPGR